LQAYLEGQSEDQLYLAQKLGKTLLIQNMAPEEIVDVHLRTLEALIPLPEPVAASFQLLTEVMIEYGNAFREHRTLRSKQQQWEAELAVAVTMQQAFLTHEIPEVPELEIGLVSVPAKQMSGDYYHFVQHEDSGFSVAIADITGKGIPAALCMSMIKYAMDSVSEGEYAPSSLLHYLNGVVERNIDPSMFITMLFGRYEPASHCFRYAAAGHEPGFWYRAAENRFCELDGEGIALGIQRGAMYPEYAVQLAPDDLLILLTDGVSERKRGDQYMSREELINVMRQEIGNPAQTMADNIYRKLLELSNFHLPDDHTMIVIRRK